MILGITGISGAGKHTAAKFFEQKGWKTRYVDKIAHRLYKPYQRVWREVTERFGEGILKKNDVIDRQKLKKIVFAPTKEAKQALRDLDAIVHPEVKRVLTDEIYYLKKKKANAVIVAALWEEIGLFELCDKVLLIRAGQELGFQRIHKRDGVGIEMYMACIENQKEPEKVDFTVVNEGNFQDFYKELNSVLSKL